MQNFLESILRVYADILENMTNVMLKHHKQIDALGAAHNEIVDGHNQIVLCLENVDLRISAIEAYLSSINERITTATKTQYNIQVETTFALPKFDAQPAEIAAFDCGGPVEANYPADNDGNADDADDDTYADDDDEGGEAESFSIAGCNCEQCKAARYQKAVDLLKSLGVAVLR